MLAALLPGVHLSRAAVVAALVAFFAVTAATFDVDARPENSDVPSYRAIADAAPGTPDEDVGSTYTGRFAVHYAVGLVGELPGLSVDAAYAIMWTAAGLALLALIGLLARGVPLAPFALVVGLVALSPYALRQSSAQMGYVQDVLFMVATAGAVLGLLRRRAGVVVASAAAAILCRQSALLTAPVIAAWVAFGPGWRPLPARRRAVLAGGLLALTGGLYAAIVLITDPFSEPFAPGFGDTLVARAGDVADDASEIASHLARTALPFVVAGAVLAALLLVVGLRRVPAAAWWLLALAAAIVVQPAALHPDFPGFAHNEQRLAAFAIVPLAAAVALLVERIERRGALAWPWLVAVGCVAAASLHPDNAAFGAESDGQFAALQLVAAVAAFGALIRLREPSRSPR